MRWHDNPPYDFSLVSTYFPVIILIFRSTIFVSVMFWIATSIKLTLQGIFIITVCAVYIDSICMHEQNFDRACGHLCVCALSFVTQMVTQEQRSCSNSQTVIIFSCDLLWSACASVEAILRSTRTHKDSQHMLKIVTCCIFASTRVILNCNALGLFEALLRTFLYNILCAVVMFCSTLLPYSNGILQCNAVAFLCGHIAFVNLYAVLASFVLILFVHGRLVYNNVYIANINMTQSTTPTPQKSPQKLDTERQNTTAANTQNYNDLYLTLQAAKRAASNSA
jgi:hypothetical protein